MYGGPDMGVKGFGRVWRAWSGYWRLWCVWRVSDVWEWVDMGMKGIWVGDGVLELIWKV